MLLKDFNVLGHLFDACHSSEERCILVAEQIRLAGVLRIMATLGEDGCALLCKTNKGDQGVQIILDSMLQPGSKGRAMGDEDKDEDDEESQQLPIFVVQVLQNAYARKSHLFCDKILPHVWDGLADCLAEHAEARQ